MPPAGAKITPKYINMPFAVLPDDCSQSSVIYKTPFVCFVIRNSSLLLIKSQKYLHFLLWVTPSAKRNTYSVAFLFCMYTQGRGAAHLNPGLGNRNSYRVAGGAYRLPI